MSQVKTVKEVLIAAKWILENVGWCKGAYAKDKFGDWLVPGEPHEVTCACSSGAIYLVEAPRKLQESAIFLLGTIVNSHVPTWNDLFSRTKEEVLQAFNKAITIAK